MLSNADGVAAPLKIGPHTIMQGDCLERLREGEPYRVKRDQKPGGRHHELSGRTFAPTETINEGTRVPTRTLEFKRETGIHPTQKPVALMEYLIRTYTDEGATVLDFTMGSGTTGVACARTGRNFIGIELDPTYYLTSAMRIAAEVGL